MTQMLNFAALVLGIYLAIRIIAALHGIVDLWHMTARVWRAAAVNVLLWCLATGAIVWLLHGSNRRALVWGVCIYAVFYLSLLPLARAYVSRRRADRSGPRPP